MIVGGDGTTSNPEAEEGVIILPHIPQVVLVKVGTIALWGREAQRLLIANQAVEFLPILIQIRQIAQILLPPAGNFLHRIAATQAGGDHGAGGSQHHDGEHQHHRAHPATGLRHPNNGTQHAHHHDKRHKLRQQWLRSRGGDLRRKFNVN